MDNDRHALPPGVTIADFNAIDTYRDIPLDQRLDGIVVRYNFALMHGDTVKYQRGADYVMAEYLLEMIKLIQPMTPGTTTTD
jgi:hypothetical protein